MPEFNQEQAVTDLQAELSKIDFDGGMVVADSTPAPSNDSAEVTPLPTPDPAATPEPKAKDAPVVSEPVAEEPAGGDDSTPESAPKETAEAAAIPDSHFRAALHMLGLPREEAAERIGAMYDKDPDLTLRWLAKCHEMTNAASKQLGDLGQRTRQLQEQVASQQPNRKAELLSKLKEKYEDDPIIDVLGELIPDLAPTPARAIQPDQSPMQQSQQPSIDQIVAMRQQINTFFGADDMDVFGDFYGKTSQTGDWLQTLTPGQRENRRAVCEAAQMILDGAAFSGMQLSVADALERAHLQVSAPMATEIVRERIAKSVQKRAKGVTLKPSGSKAPAPAGGVHNKEQAVQEMAAELKQVFGN